MYLDLIKPLSRSDQVLIESKAEEKERCSNAIKLAQEGIKVALFLQNLDSMEWLVYFWN